ncbi:hypothetical protein [Mycolicibacterium baixiangningiae]|nr:hypothetical protein [Mycolicibacterium baixiangningiae]
MNEADVATTTGKHRLSSGCIAGCGFRANAVDAAGAVAVRRRR